MDEFRCIASKCKHNCCIGWEIDIDDTAYDLYMSVQSSFGNKLRNNICDSNGIKYFVLDKNGRCPFLNSDNLCDIIIELGEEFLCNICKEHPRFYIETSKGFKLSYGLCCEAACKLCLEDKACVDNGIFAVCENLSNTPYFDTFEKIEDFCGFILKLERLDFQWDITVRKLINRKADTKQLYNTYKNEFGHFMEYLRLRWDSYFADVMWQFVLLLCASFEADNNAISIDDIEEICRQYSAEIEYSDENVRLITEYISFS